jgi:tripeptide aminopeptidase
VRRVKEKNGQHGLLQAIFTICEEIGLYGAKHLDFDKVKASRIFVFDSNGPIGKIVVKAPARNQIKAVIKGKSAHAGICPELGISAIQVAADAISQMKLLRIDEETTANIGIITAGNATNIVTEEALVIGEARSASPERLALQVQHMTECFESAAAKFNALVDIEIEHCYQAFTLDEKDPAIRHCIEAMERLGIKPELQSTGGGSDCNIFNANGITAVDLAIGMMDVHTKMESIKIADLEMGARLVEALIECVRN